MHKSLVATILLLAAILTLPRPVTAAPMVCAPRDAMLAQLHADFGEVERYNAMDEQGRFIVVVTVAGEGRFTVLLVRPDKQTCIILFGHSWVALSRPAPHQLQVPNL